MNYIFDCPEQKPNLQNLVLDFGYDQKSPPLSSIYRLVNGNFNLKSLSLKGMNDETTTIREVIQVLSCDHGLQEFELGGTLGRIMMLAGAPWKKIKRDKFPETIENLKKFLE